MEHWGTQHNKHNKTTTTTHGYSHITPATHHTINTTRKHTVIHTPLHTHSSNFNKTPPPIHILLFKYFGNTYF